MILLKEGVTLPKTKNPKNSQDVRLDNQLCFAVYAASHKIEQHYQTLLKAQGLTYTQYLVLMALSEEDGVSISHLARRLDVSGATMTPILRRLEEKELLRRDVQDGNERQKIVTLTEAGRSIWIKSCGISSEVFSQIGLTQREADEIIRICKKIVDK
ncbi:MarR family transcriptional regulator [Ruegeria sp.]|uniref:MarR family winged helix-turn-helix transcriptional regulator n=1 Tax=Ruegeria sp. TaxID=1879320 RepID=UPI00230EFD8D|nr:MarR family transcriptional regulator [Ruegeria sp.]MDA7963578.1 MarR family transcriptional regulator [Ruegeria sp.]